MKSHFFETRFGLGVLLAALILGPAHAGEHRAPAESVYHPVHMRDDGTADPASLERATAALQARIGDRPAEIVLLVHGFNTTEEWAREQYETITDALREQMTATPGSPPESTAVEVVGVHWPSHPGPPWKWIPQVVAYRAVAELGFREAVRNPYWRKVELARRTGRKGLRTALFRLQDRFRHARFHALAHSMGSEVVLRALAPDLPSRAAEQGITEPARVCRLGLVTLAGADLDEDVFTNPKEPTARLALDRAAIWWLTVSKRDVADAVLELRRGAGRRDAIGNRGITLHRADLERLLGRQGLVIDDQELPITHRIEDYYGPARMAQTLRTLAYLRDPDSAEAKRSIPAALEPYTGSAPAVRYAPLALTSLRLYTQWREQPQARSYGTVRVSERSLADLGVVREP